MTTIGDGAFLDNQLTSVVIPDSVTTIGHRAFEGNQLTSVVIPDSVIAISWSAFEDNQLTEVNFLGNRPTGIGTAFLDNNQLFNISYCLIRTGWPGDPLDNGVANVNPVGIDCDSDGDGLVDSEDPKPFDSTNLDTDEDGVVDDQDAFPNDSSETLDSDGDAVGDNSDAFPLDASESVDTDGDGIGNNADLDDDGDGFTDEEELAEGSNPLSRFSCKSGCFIFDVDGDLETAALTDGLIIIRYLFGFSGATLTNGALGIDAARSSEAVSSYLTDSNSELDIDGDGTSGALTDGLLLIRYLFGFSGGTLLSGAMGDGAERDTAVAVEAYIEERIPVQ